MRLSAIPIAAAAAYLAIVGSVGYAVAKHGHRAADAVAATLATTSMRAPSAAAEGSDLRAAVAALRNARPSIAGQPIRWCASAAACR